MRLWRYGDGRMSNGGQVGMYRIHAGACIKLAQKTEDSESKLLLLDMARAWLNLADQGERYGQTTLVYETPEPPQRTVRQEQPRQQDEKE